MRFEKLKKKIKFLNKGNKLSLLSFRKITDKKLLYDLKETYMYENIEVFISPTYDYTNTEDGVVYKTQDHDISRQIEIITKYIKATKLYYLDDVQNVKVVMSGYSEGDMCDTYIFIVKKPVFIIRGQKGCFI